MSDTNHILCFDEQLIDGGETCHFEQKEGDLRFHLVFTCHFNAIAWRHEMVGPTQYVRFDVNNQPISSEYHAPALPIQSVQFGVPQNALEIEDVVCEHEQWFDWSEKARVLPRHREITRNRRMLLGP